MGAWNLHKQPSSKQHVTSDSLPVWMEKTNKPNKPTALLKFFSYSINVTFYRENAKWSIVDSIYPQIFHILFGFCFCC